MVDLPGDWCKQNVRNMVLKMQPMEKAKRVIKVFDSTREHKTIYHFTGFLNQTKQPNCKPTLKVT